MTTLSVCFTNFGPYHLARLRALSQLLERSGDRLIAYEVADQECRYPWSRDRGAQPFEWVTLFPGRSLESIAKVECDRAMIGALNRDRPDALGIVGYSRPESMTALRWARQHGRPTILMSESQEIDHPRTWWKEAVKRRRVARFSSALVGGPRHRDYLVTLGMPGCWIALGYNAVDNQAFRSRAEAARTAPEARDQPPSRPYFLAVNRFVPEKNLPSLVRAFARYRADAPSDRAWDLVLCGDGPDALAVDRAVSASGLGHAIHGRGFFRSTSWPPGWPKPRRLFTRA